MYNSVVIISILCVSYVLSNPVSLSQNATENSRSSLCNIMDDCEKLYGSIKLKETRMECMVGCMYLKHDDTGILTFNEAALKKGFLDPIFEIQIERAIINCKELGRRTKSRCLSGEELAHCFRLVGLISDDGVVAPACI